MYTQARILTIVTIITLALSVATCEANSQLDPMDTINDAPVCYVTAEFMSYYGKVRMANLETIYTNYSNTNRAVMFFEEKKRAIKETPTEVASNTAALMFNKATHDKRKALVDTIINYGPRQAVIMFGEIYEKMNCDRFSKPISLDSYNFFKKDE